MEIKIPKEVREYHETIFFGLNTRQFVCSLLAVGVAVAVYFLLQPMLDTEEIGWVCILAAAPFAVCGFFTYHGMTPEQLLWAWCKSELLCPKRLVFRSDSYYYAAMQPAIQAGLHQKRKRGKRIMAEALWVVWPWPGDCPHMAEGAVGVAGAARLLITSIGYTALVSKA